MLVPKIALVFDRRHTADKKKKGSIELRITLGKNKKFMSTGIQCLPHQWKGGNPYVSGYETSGEDNVSLAAIVKKASKIIADMVERDEIDLDAIPRLMKHGGVDITFLAYLRQRIEAKNVVEYTKASYISFYNKVSEYGKIKFFSDITEKSIRDFDEWLHRYEWTETDRYGSPAKKRYSQATIGSFHKNMKAFIADAVIDGYLKENVYVAKGIKVSKGEARIDKFLTVAELEKVKTADMPTQSLSVARDLFVFQCLTGLSYVDLMGFDASKIVENDGVLIYSSRRHKTNIKFTCAITKSAKAILDKYSGRLPKIPNQKYNVKLKLVADAAGIDKPISSHYARRSAAYLWLNEGVPMDVVSKILGHTNLSQTSQYAEILEKTIAQQMKDFD